MEVTKAAIIAGVETPEIENRIDEKQLRQLMEKIRRTKKIYVCGVDGSLLISRCFTMCLMHVGYGVYVVGDTTTSAFEGGDLLIVGTASGEIIDLISITDRARSYGGTIVVCSIFPESSLGRRANTFVRVPTYTDKLPESDDNKKDILPGGNMFEISILILFDIMIMPLAEKKGVATSAHFARHINLE